MASKQPFKLFNIAQKLTTWSIRIRKFFKHRLLSKRKNVLIISEEQATELNGFNSFFFIDKDNQSLKKYKMQTKAKLSQNQLNFEHILLKNMSKTWEISQVKSLNKNYEDLQMLLNCNERIKSYDQLKKVDKKSEQPSQGQQEPSMILISKFSDKKSVQALQKYWTAKKKYFDSIIVMPQKQQKNSYPQINDEAFATNFITTLQQKLIKNIVAYRYAHKFLNTSGTFIQSTSEYDFIKKTDEQKEKELQKAISSKQQKSQDTFSFALTRNPAAKQIIDNCVCYLGVLIGNRDYTDFNSWSLVSLGEQASRINPQFVGKMYYDWADGQHLPMPGSFGLFKKKVIKNKKQMDYVQYL